ncbi:MAG TPA: hypothetical protein VFO79_06255, partial [Xanthomonadales bacterium]|nr:hypothetical protein [Xanthomonadales bacterium]
RSRLGLSVGIELRDAPLVLDPAALRELDVLVADDRGWAAAGRAERAAIVEAVRDGLGLLLRATGPLPASVAEAWGTLGLVHESVENHVATLSLGTGPEAPPALTLLPLRATSPSASPLPLAGQAAGWWMPHGRGRVALWRLIDSHRLVTAGHAPRHAELWAGVLERLARARGSAPPRLEGIARAGERMVLCGVAADATVLAPDGTRTGLVALEGGAHGRCAAYWPRVPGWHALVPDESMQDAAPDTAPQRETGADPIEEPHRVFVYPRDAAPALAAAARTAATQALAARGAPRDVAPGPAWPPAWVWWAAWLAILAACWWLERRALAGGVQ